MKLLSVLSVFSVSLSRALLSITKVNIFSVAFIRCIIISILTFIMNNKTKFILSKKILLRTILQSSSILLVYYGYHVLPLVTATLIGQTGPAINSLIACICGESKYNHKLLIKIFLGYSGIIIIYGMSNISSISGVMSMLCANILTSISLVITKELFNKNRILDVEFSTVSIQSIIFGTTYLFASTFTTKMDILYASSISVFIFIGRITQFYIIRSYSIAKFAPFEYLQILFAYILDYFITGLYTYDFPTIAGTILILLSVLI